MAFLLQILSNVFNVLCNLGGFKLEGSSRPAYFVNKVSIVGNGIIFEVFLRKVFNRALQFGMGDPKLLDELFEAFDDLLFSAFSTKLLFEATESVFLPLPDDCIKFLDPDDLILNGECLEVNDINSSMNVEANRIVNRDVDVNKL
jgi:hypothetical protein